MRFAIVFSLVFSLILTISAEAPARETRGGRPTFERPWSYELLSGQDVEIPLYRDAYGYLTSAQVDTFVIVYYDFESMSWNGWTRFDNTAQRDTFWHVEDYLEPELAGLPGPLAGTKSAWCGAPPAAAEYLCSWVSAPGYGNGWDQRLVSEPFLFTNPLTVAYRLSLDSESSHDRLWVEYDGGGENWLEIASYDGLVDTTAAHELFIPKSGTKLRFRFTSDGSWSDEDGKYDSDGASHLDDIGIGDAGGTIDFEDFESASDNSRSAGIWRADAAEPFGLYSGLAMGLQDKDPCNKNFRTQAVFFVGSPYASSEYPGLYDTPHHRYDGAGDLLNQDEMIISPVIDMTRHSTNEDAYQDSDIPPGFLPLLGGAKLKFTVFRDLPLNELFSAFSRWYFWRVRNIVDGCPGAWLSRDMLYYGDEAAFIFAAEEIGDLVRNDSIQVALGLVDLCDPWYGGCTYNPTPWFDNIRIERYVATGPQWSYSDVDLFQDNFPMAEFMLESWVRADAAIDIRPVDDPRIDPGDSVVVECAAPVAGGLRENINGPEVCLHLRVRYIGDPLHPKPPLAGPVLAGTYGTYVGDDGTWTILQGEPARAASGEIAPDRYMFDLNDSLLTRGYTVEYYFKAYDLADNASTLPKYAQSKGVFFEFTCLPALTSDILYVDDYHGIGTIDGIPQHYWESAFHYCVPPDDYPDRYDVNAPSSRLSNGPGSRAKNYQMTAAYEIVIWDSGDLPTGTISEGTSHSDKSNDAQMLVDWMRFSGHDVNLWVCGDNVAADLDGATSAIALELLTTYCGVQFAGDGYYDLGGIVSPLAEAYPSVMNPFWHGIRGDSFYVFGGCPAINHFDYLDKTANGYYAFQYPDAGREPRYAGIHSWGINDGGYDIRTLWFGFSFMYLRDAALGTPIMRAQVCWDALSFFEHDVNWWANAGEVPAENALAQNFPNPFNPVTTIPFGLKARGPVSLRIYNVAGQLVRTLVDEVRDAGSYREVWDGRNNRGSRVASGVYFYRMTTEDFERTKKMILLR